MAETAAIGPILNPDRPWQKMGINIRFILKEKDKVPSLALVPG